VPAKAPIGWKAFGNFLHTTSVPTNFLCVIALVWLAMAESPNTAFPGASSSYFNEWKDTILDVSHNNPILEPTNDLCPTFQDKKDGLWNFDVARLPNGEVLERMKLGIIGLLQPARVLDILQHFIVFERVEGKIIKKVARYQQLRAANKIADRVINSDLNQGVIWHTQGSGKSLTMLYTAYKLRQSKELKDPTIYIVVDRKEFAGANRRHL
jgi:type I restriction enzyme R subunit